HEAVQKNNERGGCLGRRCRRLEVTRPLVERGGPVGAPGRRRHFWFCLGKTATAQDQSERQQTANERHRSDVYRGMRRRGNFRQFCAAPREKSASDPRFPMLGTVLAWPQAYHESLPILLTRPSDVCRCPARL